AYKKLVDNNKLLLKKHADNLIQFKIKMSSQMLTDEKFILGQEPTIASMKNLQTEQGELEKTYSEKIKEEARRIVLNNPRDSKEFLSYLVNTNKFADDLAAGMYYNAPEIDRKMLMKEALSGSLTEIELGNVLINH